MRIAVSRASSPKHSRQAPGKLAPPPANTDLQLRLLLCGSALKIPSPYIASMLASRQSENFWKDRLNDHAARNDCLPLAA